MESIKYLFDKAPQNYKTMLSNMGIFDWNTHTIKINTIRINNDKYIDYECLEKLMYIFNISCSTSSMENINNLFAYYSRGLNDIYGFNCPREYIGNQYIDYYDVDKLFRSANTQICKLFYTNCIKIRSDITDIINIAFGDELDKLQKTHVIVTKGVYEKLGQDNRNMHNKNSKLIQENKLLEQKLKLMQEELKSIKESERLSDSMTISMTDSDNSE